MNKFIFLIRDGIRVGAAPLPYRRSVSDRLRITMSNFRVKGKGIVLVSGDGKSVQALYWKHGRTLDAKKNIATRILVVVDFFFVIMSLPCGRVDEVRRPIATMSDAVIRHFFYSLRVRTLCLHTFIYVN